VVGPQGFSPLTCRMDFREGGRTLVGMRSDQGWELYNTWTYRSIKPMERIELVRASRMLRATTKPRPNSDYHLVSRTRSATW
jgi:uncharacterized protein YndB with AHSA1/START domain